LKRIEPTLIYAISQDNNHGTSEAAALFIGGYWLSRTQHHSTQAVNWGKKGRRWLEERIAKLILEDGTFSQYSVNYHRLVLDTLCMVEIFRRDFGLPLFSEDFYCRASLATTWLFSVAQPNSGAPNLGPNDGAQLLALSNADYRDFRPSVQLASVLFLRRCAYQPGRWNLPLAWLDVEIPASILDAPVSCEFKQGGLVFIKNTSASVYLRYPRYRFRPSQADVFHVDLWVGSVNVLRDAHNTIQVGGREPMRKISRFLYGDWVNTDVITPLQVIGGRQFWRGRYRDCWGTVHTRTIELFDDHLCVTDEISQCKIGAKLRWRLAPSNWKLDGFIVSSDLLQLNIEAEGGVDSINLVEGWESLYYHQMTPVPVLEVVFSKQGKIKSYFNWSVSK
jgi:hypothetical protein